MNSIQKNEYLNNSFTTGINEKQHKKTCYAKRKRYPNTDVIRFKSNQIEMK